MTVFAIDRIVCIRTSLAIITVFAICTVVNTSYTILNMIAVHAINTTLHIFAFNTSLTLTRIPTLITVYAINTAV